VPVVELLNRNVVIPDAMLIRFFGFMGFFFYGIATYIQQPGFNNQWMPYLGVAFVGIILFLGEVLPGIGKMRTPRNKTTPINQMAYPTQQFTYSAQRISVADESNKLAKLKEQGVISEDEFQRLKRSLLDSA
jgi:hypothetical protein